MGNKILHTTIMQKNVNGDKTIIYPKTVTKNIIDGSSTLEQTLNTLKLPDVSNKTTEFKQADTRENLVSGETIAISHSKIMKLISDLKSLAYTDTVGVSNLDSTLTTAYNNRVTTDKVTTSTTITSVGYVADARAVNNLQNQINTVNNNLGNYWSFYGGTEIPNQTDLDNVIDFGNYYCHANVNVTTLINCPTNQAFMMKVYSGTGSESRQYLIQELTTHNEARKYTRTCFIYSDGRKEWREWKKIIVGSDIINYFKETGMSVTASTDWNDLVDVGSYSVGTVSGANAPKAYAYGMLLVFKSGSIILQIYIPHSNITTNTEYLPVHRIRYGTTWVNWRNF